MGFSIFKGCGFGESGCGKVVSVSIALRLPLYHATLFVITFSTPRFPPNICMFGFGFRVALLSAWLSSILLVYLFWRN